MQQDGENTLLILTLTEATQQYTIETGQLLKSERRPYFHISFRETRDY